MNARAFKILHLGKFYPPEFGGIESVTQALAEDQSANCHRVTVLAFSRNESAEEKSGRLTIWRCRVLGEWFSQPLSISYLVRGFLLARDTQVIHVHAPNMIAALVAITAPSKVPVVLHWHADVVGKGWLGEIMRPLERLLVRRASVIVATSEAYSGSSRQLRGVKEKVRVIPIGISDILYPHRTEDGRRHNQLLFVGRLVRYKGLDVLLKALSHIKHAVTLKVVGAGPERHSLEELAVELGVQDSVSFLGKVDSHTLDHLFSTSGIFCLPSINRLEAFGVALLEAMRSGCACVSSDIDGSGVPWVNDAGGRFPAGDDRELAKVITDLLDNPALRSRYEAGGRRRYEQLFRREVMSNKFMALYQEVVSAMENPLQ